MTKKKPVAKKMDRVRRREGIVPPNKGCPRCGQSVRPQLDGEDWWVYRCPGRSGTVETFGPPPGCRFTGVRGVRAAHADECCSDEDLTVYDRDYVQELVDGWEPEPHVWPDQATVDGVRRLLEMKCRDGGRVFRIQYFSENLFPMEYVWEKHEKGD